MFSRRVAAAARWRRGFVRALVSGAFLLLPCMVALAMPTLSGTPISSVIAAHSYLFQPTANNVSGKLTYLIVGKPVWATFDATTGRLSGTPQTGNVGTSGSISIWATDGSSSAYLPPFSITVLAGTNTTTSTPPVVVTPAKTGAATLSWQPPTQTTGGAVLTNLAGYRIYFGTTPANLQQAVVLANPGLTRYVVGGLTGSTWYFQMTAYDRNGMESPPTSVERFTLQ
jgi:hypothetical protein